MLALLILHACKQNMHLYNSENYMGKLQNKANRVLAVSRAPENAVKKPFIVSFVRFKSFIQSYYNRLTGNGTDKVLQDFLCQKGFFLSH